MSKIVVCNTSQQTLTLSNSVYRAISNVVSAGGATVTNTLIENIACMILTNGLRNYHDHVLHDGQRTDALITIAYLETNLKGNTE